MLNMPSVDIIIPHYPHPDIMPLAVTCLRTIEKYSSDYRLIFVVNGLGNSDELEEELRHHPSLVIRLPKNVGFVKAVNMGLKAIKSPYVVLMNNDTEAVPGWLEKLREPFRDSVIGAVGPLTNTTKSWQGCVPPTITHTVSILSHPDAMLAFFCVMIRKKVIDLIGLLDESFGVGLGDDDDYCARIMNAGYKLAVVRDLVIPHHHRSTFRTLYSEADILGMQQHAHKIFHQKYRRSPKGGPC